MLCSAHTGSVSRLQNMFAIQPVSIRTGATVVFYIYIVTLGWLLLTRSHSMESLVTLSTIQHCCEHISALSCEASAIIYFTVWSTYGREEIANYAPPEGATTFCFLNLEKFFSRVSRDK